MTKQLADAAPLFGRADELAVLERAVRDARLGTSRVTVVRGEPGIGKTALIDRVVELAVSGDMDVLSSRGVASEAEVPFGGLLELLRPALDELDRIPPPQAEALRSALDLGPTVERNRFVIGAATLNVLSARSERAPLLVVIDDAQWLDDSSLTAMLFAARRLLVDPVAVVFAARTAELPALDGARLPELRLEGVDARAATEIVARHGGVASLQPEVAERLVTATGGNPLALVELAARGIDLMPEPAESPLGQETSVEAEFGRRIAELPEPAQRVLALAAAEDEGRLASIGPAAEALDLLLADLAHAERAGLVSISYGVLSWRHALVRSAAYRRATADERRAMHAALAGALPAADADRRAWHRAAAALGPDEDVAAALEDASGRARSRSAYAAAATAAERAAQLSPGDRPRARRLMAAAEAAWLGGRPERTLTALEEALALSPGPRLRGQIEHLRGQALIRAGDVMEGYGVLVGSARGVEDVDRAGAIVMLADAADACVYAGRPDAMLAPARRAYELLGDESGERERFFANIALGTAVIYAGEGDEGARRLREAVTILESSDVLSGEPRSLAAAAVAPLWLREKRAGPTLIDRAIDAARSQSALGVLPFALMLAARDAATSDRWAVGRSLYQEAIEFARETDQAMPLAGALAGLASVQARQGDADACEAGTEEALRLSERHGLGLFRIWALDALAELELGRGRLVQAVERLEDKRRTLEGFGLTDPDLSPVPELVEAAVRGGELDGVASRLHPFAREAEAKGQPWALARLQRSRGLLAEPDDQEGHFADALDLHAAARDRFEEARTRVCFGECLRRAGQRVKAREQLRAALDAFDDLGAVPWAERARSELVATGERARRRDPSTLDELTPQELQIGMLLAGGHTTREAAAKLFLSPKTVEYHLRNAYRKLDIHSRDELADELSRLPSHRPDD